MTKTSNKTKATHTARPSAAKLETPKAKPAAALKAEHHKEIRAESFELVDAQGNERACLKLIDGHAVLAMHDSRGKLRLTMRASANTAILTIFSDRDGDDDVVERVEIGYGEGVHSPSVIISDGDGDKRVIVGSKGVSVFDRDGETLAEYCAPENGADHVEDRPAAALSIGPTAAPINEAAIRELVEGCLPRDDDEAATAFIALIHAIAYNDDRLDRDSIAIYACNAAYQRTLAYSEKAGKFFDDSKAGESAQVA